MKIYFNYANLRCYETQKIATKQALKFGNFDKVYNFGIKDIDTKFLSEHKTIMSNPKGAGLWLWKYYLINKILNLMDEVPEDSYIFYADADLYIIDKIDYLIDCMDNSIMTFRSPNPYMGKLQCKRDAFVLTQTDSEEFLNSNDRGGGILLLKKDDYARKFFRELLDYGCDRRILDSSLDNQLGYPNYPGFIRHAEDEALTSLIAKKYKLYPFRWPCQSKNEWYEKRDRDVASNPNVFTNYEYPELIPNKSLYPKMMEHYQIHD